MINKINIASIVGPGQVEVLAKIYWGDARRKLCEAVDDLKVDSFVLGCRGLGPLKR